MGRFAQRRGAIACYIEKHEYPMTSSDVWRGDVISSSKCISIIEMLKNGSIDAWAYGDIPGIWLIQQSGANVSDYRVAHVLSQGDGYYAFNKESPDYLVQSFQQALDYIKSNKDSSGVSDYDKILAKYIPRCRY